MAVTVPVRVSTARPAAGSGPAAGSRPIARPVSTARAVPVTTARAVPVAVVGAMSVWRLGRWIRGLLRRGHRPIIARTDGAHCSARPM